MEIETWIALISVVVTNAVALGIFFISQQRKRQEEMIKTAEQIATMEVSLSNLQGQLSGLRKSVERLTDVMMRKGEL